MKAIYNGNIVTPTKVIKNGWIIFDNNIRKIGSGSLPNLYQYESVNNAEDYFIMPGLIDIHTHGCIESDVMDASISALNTMSAFLCKQGVTAFAPTTITRPWNEVEKALAVIQQCMLQGEPGARVLGAHLEGPFINYQKKGAHLSDFIIKPNFELIKPWLDTIKIITYAPECDESSQFIHQVMSLAPDMVLSLGHSVANYQQACQAIALGSTSATHIFNGMVGLHHREPGIIAAILESGVFCELIADNYHVHPVWYKLLSKLKGIDKIILVSDAMMATGCADGYYDIGGQEVQVIEGKTLLVKTGALAGSTLTLNKAVANFKQHTSLGWPEVINMASLNPAKLLGIDKYFGSLQSGKKADFMICDSNMNVFCTIIDGEKVFEKNTKIFGKVVS